MQNTTNTASQSGQNDPTSVFAALGAEPDIAVGIVRSDGHILHANDTGVKMYFDRPASDVIGKNYLDIFPKELAQERIAAFASLTDPNKAIVYHYTWRGVRMRAVYRLIPGEADELNRVLVVARPATDVNNGYPDEGFEHRESSVIELGELAVLSPRELEILALLGQGMRIREIAETLDRSQKTIERHREAIGQKLGAADRAELIQIAQRAGLRVEDAQLKRVHFEQ